MPTSSATDCDCPAAPAGFGHHRGDRRAGFTLMEVVLAMTIIAMLAALGLPFLRPNTGIAALRMKGFEITALLRAERNAALRSGTVRTVLVNAEARVLQASQSAARIELPPSMVLSLTPRAPASVRFFPNGKATRSRLLIRSGTNAVAVDVNSLTAAVNPSGTPP